MHLARKACWLAFVAGLRPGLVIGPSLGWAASESDTPLAVIEGMLVDGNGGPPVHDAVILIQVEKIMAVGLQGTVQIPEDAQIISAGGMSVLPGLFDLHVHLILMGHGEYDE